MYHVISNIRKLQSKNSKMQKFTDNLAIYIPKAIEKIPNRVGPLARMLLIYRISRNIDSDLIWRLRKDRQLTYAIIDPFILQA